MDAVAKAPRNPALFADGTDGLDVKTLNITNRSQVCGVRSAARFDHPNLPRVNASAAFHAAVLAQPKKIRDGTEAAQPPEYPAYLHHVKSLEIVEISRLFRCLPSHP